MSSSKPFRISVIGGGGMVGASTAYALMVRNVPAEILVVDIMEQAAQGQALDIADASFTQNGTCRKGSFEEAGQSDLVIITAGLPQKPGQTRQELLGANAKIMKSICESMAPIRKDLKILVVSNPCDTMTHLAQKFSKLPKNQVFGSGTYLDSGRLRCYLSELTGVHASSINAYVLGEHGDRQFVAWSTATIGGQPLLEHPKIQGHDLDGIRESVMRRAYTIIDAKRSTYFGIGMCAAQIAEAVVYNTQAVFPLVQFRETAGIYMCWPCSLGSNGINQVFDIKLNDKERENEQKAITAISEMAKEADSSVSN